MIKRFSVKNFRSLLNVSVDLAPVTVLVGRSGTGKTNFVQAIELLRTIIESGANVGPLNQALMRFGSPNGFRPANIKGAGFNTEFQITFDVPGYKGDFVYKLEIEFNRSPNNNIRVSSESMHFRDQALYSQADGKWAIEPKLANAGMSGGAAPGNVLLGQLTGLPEVNVAYISLVQSIRSYSFPGNVLADNSSPGPVRVEVLNETGSNAMRVVDGIVGSIKALPDWREIEMSLKTLSASLIGITVNPSGNPAVGGGLGASFRLGDTVVSVDIAQQSEGFRRFLAHLLAIYQNVTQQVIIFEEPEKGIFPGALSLLADHIKSANEKLGTQFILTTHSPQLLDAFPGDSIRWVRFSDHGTQISPLPPDEIIAIREGLMSPSELLTVADSGEPKPARE